MTGHRECINQIKRNEEKNEKKKGEEMMSKEELSLLYEEEEKEKKYKETDSLQTYLNEIGRHPLLTIQEEIELGRKARDGDRAARDALVQANLRLVVSVAKKYLENGFTMQDLIQEGNIGLLTAAERFDPDQGCRFSTYATYWIRETICRYIYDNYRLIRLPVHVCDARRKLNKTINDLSLKYHREPTIEEIAKAANLPEEKVTDLLTVSSEIMSLDKPLQGEEVDDYSYGNLIGDEKIKSPEDETAETMLRDDIKTVLKTLSEKERKIIIMRYGLATGETMTLGQIADIMNVSRERIRQIEARALNKLRIESNAAVLRDYYAS